MSTTVLSLPERLDPPRYMTVMEFATRLDRGIPLEDLKYFRRTRVAAYEDLPDYLNFLRSLGSVMLSRSLGLFVRINSSVRKPDGTRTNVGKRLDSKTNSWEEVVA